MIMEKTHAQRIAEKIKAVLHEKGWTQRELAAHLDISAQAVQQWVKGKTAPRGNNLLKLSEATGKPQHWFLSIDDNNKNSALDHAAALRGDDKYMRILEILSDLPDSDVEQIERELILKRDYYERKVEELLRKRNKPA
ncbi:hypothetical protein BK025_06385 [Sodalis sp. TME1]|nr:hypothetical protein BK025_06385 [Sodalis sp. TME1]